MEITIKGDKEFDDIPSIKSKALRINLNENIYGTFAEIGAGQETVRNFFRAGGASGTIAKAMSAYDKDFSDAVYGIENDKRYVTEARLKKMLYHETKLIEDRISREKHPNKLFFTYANTVATIDFAKKYKGHGWVGIRYQVEPDQEYNEIVLHIRFKENDAKLQQETLGILGTNLIYGAFYKYNEPRKLLRYLYDHLHKDQVEIKKNILTLRGSFRPVTKVNMDMYQKSYDMFIKENRVDSEKTQTVFEITLSNLRAAGEIDEQDFMDRARLLCSLGHTVMISNFKEYYKLVEYYSQYTKMEALQIVKT